MSQFKLHKEALGAGYKSAKLMKDSFFKVDDRAVSALIDSLQNDMATANSAVLRMVNDVYRETIFKSAMFVKNGVYTEKQAYDMAVKTFLDKGINCIQYKDGRRVNIADYAEMAVRTASQRAHLAGQGEFRKEIGRTLILISRHNTACELCKPFEHKVLIDDVYSGGKPEDGDYMLLSEAMKLGFYHPRCRHGCGTYYPELEGINHYESEDNKLNEYGDDKINSAHVENMIQKYKRLSLGSTLPENVAKYSGKLKYWESLKRPEKVDNITESDIIKSGAISGARNPDGVKAKEHARRYYDLVRSMKTDVDKIAKTTGMSKAEIQSIKDFIFYEKHDLGGFEPKRFEPDYMMAESWQRLIDGKPKKHDLTLIKHEVMEKWLMKQGMSQDEAHILTSKKYNYDKEAREFYGKIKKYKD
ncbi:MAG: hypothetical protein J6L91_07490, partial [Clostridia bacterium]|nr:hypothetical protein [Clostridia bacterium]